MYDKKYCYNCDILFILKLHTNPVVELIQSKSLVPLNIVTPVYFFNLIYYYTRTAY